MIRNALVYGAKKWLLYPPHSMIMSHTQISNFVETEMQPLIDRGVQPVTCVQTAGDVIIVPEGWGHGVLNLQVMKRTVSIAIRHCLGYCCHCNGSCQVDVADP